MFCKTEPLVRLTVWISADNHPCKLVCNSLKFDFVFYFASSVFVLCEFRAWRFASFPVICARADCYISTHHLAAARHVLYHPAGERSSNLSPVSSRTGCTANFSALCVPHLVAV